MSKNPDETVVAIPVHWEATASAPTIYANQMFITHAGNEFYLVFGEIEPIFQLDKDNLPDHFSIRPRVKIAITPKDMIEFARIIEENVATFQNRVSENSEDNNGDS